MPRPLHVSISASLQVRFQEAIDSLLRQVTRDADRSAALAQARAVLETLPLTTEEFGLAVNRLANAQRYFQSGERGAAWYELRLLRRSFEM
jgi:hypothetical protein